MNKDLRLVFKTTNQLKQKKGQVLYYVDFLKHAINNYHYKLENGKYEEELEVFENVLKEIDAILKERGVLNE